ncbi:hypothetical protein TorRG33x02_073860, partial [Trema orientale]
VVFYKILELCLLIYSYSLYICSLQVATGKLIVLLNEQLLLMVLFVGLRKYPTGLRIVIH